MGCIQTPPITDDTINATKQNGCESSEVPSTPPSQISPNISLESPNSSMINLPNNSINSPSARDERVTQIEEILKNEINEKHQNLKIKKHHQHNPNDNINHHHNNDNNPHDEDNLFVHRDVVLMEQQIQNYYVMQIERLQNMSRKHNKMNIDNEIALLKQQQMIMLQIEQNRLKQQQLINNQMNNKKKKIKKKHHHKNRKKRKKHHHKKNDQQYPNNHVVHHEHDYHHNPVIDDRHRLNVKEKEKEIKIKNIDESKIYDYYRKKERKISTETVMEEALQQQQELLAQIDAQHRMNQAKKQWGNLNYLQQYEQYDDDHYHNKYDPNPVVPNIKQSGKDGERDYID